MFDIRRAKGMIRFDGSSGNQGVGHLDTVGERVLFDDRGCGGADGFGQGQDTSGALSARGNTQAFLDEGAGFHYCLRMAERMDGHQGVAVVPRKPPEYCRSPPHDLPPGVRAARRP